VNVRSPLQSLASGPLVALLALPVVTLGAHQDPAAAPAPQASQEAAPAPAMRAPHPSRNVRVTVTLTDQLGASAPVVRTAILTIAGYSINDTVVVYDRIRENLRKFKAMNPGDIINLSLNDTLSRTLLTSGTTLIALLILFFFGGEVIKGFSFAMTWGIVVGTYSSIFIASPLLIHMNLRRTMFETEEEGGNGVS